MGPVSPMMCWFEVSHESSKIHSFWVVRESTLSLYKNSRADGKLAIVDVNINLARQRCEKSGAKL